MREAAVDRVDLARDPIRIGREQPSDEAGDLLGPADAPERVHLFGKRPRCFAGEQRRGERRIDEARRDGVDADVAWRVAGGGGAHETVDPGLGGGDGFMRGQAGLRGD